MAGNVSSTGNIFPDVAIKAPVAAATTGANIVLAGVQTIDGVVVGNQSERVLVKDQTDSRTNGIYAAQSGVWQRTTDASGNADYVDGTQVLVAPGPVANANGGLTWAVSCTDVPIIIGTSFLTWRLLSTPLAPFVNSTIWTSPRNAQEFGGQFVGAGALSVTTSGNGWMVRPGFGSIWVSIVTVPGVQRIDPVSGTVIATINIGTPGNEEIRAICIAFGSVWACGRLTGNVYRIDPSTNAVICTIAGFFAGLGQPGQQGVFGLCADNASLYASETITAGSKLNKLNPALATSGTVAKAACLIATCNLGGQDTHVPSWDGDVSIWVPNLSTDNALYQVNTATMTLTTTKSIASGGAWGTFSNALIVLFTELSNDTFAYFPVKGGSGARFSLPAGSAAADIGQLDDEIWIALSTGNTNGELGVYDAATFAQKKLIALNGVHASSFCEFGPDVWNVNSISQALQRVRRRHRWTVGGLS